MACTLAQGAGGGPTGDRRGRRFREGAPCACSLGSLRQNVACARRFCVETRRMARISAKRGDRFVRGRRRLFMKRVYDGLFVLRGASADGVHRAAPERGAEIEPEVARLRTPSSHPWRSWHQLSHSCTSFHGRTRGETGPETRRETAGLEPPWSVPCRSATR